MMLLLVRLAIRFMVITLYHVRAINRFNVPKKGPALILSNHASLMDGFLVGWAARHRNVRFMICSVGHVPVRWGE